MVNLYLSMDMKQYESWQLGVSFQLDDSWLVVACPGDGIAVWCPNSFYDDYIQ
jgi:hypothetical protein